MVTKKKIVLASGTFDLLHLGHVRFLEEAKKLAGYWDIARRIYHCVHLVDIHLPAQRHIYMSLVRLLRKDVPV